LFEATQEYKHAITGQSDLPGSRTPVSNLDSRASNEPGSLEYVGRPGYTPKRIDCKAKTADIDIASYRLAGLVVDPGIHPKAFKPGKAAKAADCWAAMKPLLGRVYKVDSDTKSKHYGCLQLQGSYIHGDYDLYDVIDIAQAHRNLAAVENPAGPASPSRCESTYCPELH
jgi:hypothetical protein